MSNDRIQDFKSALKVEKKLSKGPYSKIKTHRLVNEWAENLKSMIYKKMIESGIKK